MNEEPIYHICAADDWQKAAVIGAYDGSAQDKVDGFIHFSTRDQVVASAVKHFTGQADLVLLVVGVGAIRQGLKWENDYPHLYAPLPIECVHEVIPLAVDPDDGQFIFPFATRDVGEDI
ncbi:MAG: hypothetical protein A2516_07160 [Alphaproteobacteria bacterium RIFOXYD12_FULL_60_8]|nr:MAG: hypothetical protein A2516_07160 [Alphaproteobacteria bacterium RIFOXYD12_FULL_60_8]